jgi:hypothetical protein
MNALARPTDSDNLMRGVCGADDASVALARIIGRLAER